MKWRLLKINPAEATEPPKPRRKGMVTLTSQQVGALVEASEGHALQVPIILAVTTGCRKGEILGPQWRDVNWGNATLQVRRSVELGKGGPRFKEPKTASGRRTIDLPAVALDALRRHRIRQNEYRLRFGPDYVDLDLICCQPDGRPISNNLVRDFQALLRRAGLPKVRFHDLRHSHATMLLTQGVHPKVVSERLGHANITLRLQTYSHILPTLGREAASKIDAVLAARTAPDEVAGGIR